MKNRLFSDKKNTGGVLTAITVIFITACLLIGRLLFFTEPVFIFNRSLLRVTSGSMLPKYPVNTVVIIKRTGFSGLKVGDVIAFRSLAVGGAVALHRISRAEGGGFYTKGDNNDCEDNQLITEKEYVGKAVFSVVCFAKYFSAASSPTGFVIYFLLPLLSAITVYYCVSFLSRRGKGE